MVDIASEINYIILHTLDRGTGMVDIASGNVPIYFTFPAFVRRPRGAA